MLETRREFLKRSAALLGGTALLGSVPAIGAMAESAPEAPAHPYPYAELDLDEVEKLAYEGYFENGCCYGVAKALILALREKVGFPYTMIPPEMFANGKEGYAARRTTHARSPRSSLRGIRLRRCRSTSRRRSARFRRLRPL